MRLLSIAVVLLGAAALAGADTVTLKNGEVVQGTYLGGTARQVRLDVNGNIQTYDVGQIQSINFADYQAAPPPPAPPPQAYRQDRDRDRDRGGYNASAAPPSPAPPPPSMGISIPADTPVTIRMIDAVNSQTARLGQTFRASIDEPVVVNGQTVVPRGADVLTKLVADERSGKIEGRTALTLALATINVNGQPVDVTSTDVKTQSGSRGARSAGVIGGGTALGAIIGGLAGGGKGAAIGAVSGAAVGTGAEVMTSGQQVKIPSETRLTFRLQSPIQL